MFYIITLKKKKSRKENGIANKKSSFSSQKREGIGRPETELLYIAILEIQN
jgi:hypothetical protein